MFHDNLRSHPRSNELARTSRAWAYVAMAATLEEFVRGFVDELTLHINGAGLTLSDMNLGVVSLVATSDFDSAASGRGQKMWSRRSAILKLAASTEVAAVPGGLRPLDGRTIKQSHLDSLWQIYGLPGQPLPSPLHALALRDLSEGRNTVAHGNVDPNSFGAQKPYSDVLRRVEQTEDIVVHLAAAGATYVANAGWTR
jgi:hypothetical protein